MAEGSRGDRNGTRHVGFLACARGLGGSLGLVRDLAFVAGGVDGAHAVVVGRARAEVLIRVGGSGRRGDEIRGAWSEARCGAPIEFVRGHCDVVARCGPGEVNLALARCLGSKSRDLGGRLDVAPGSVIRDVERPPDCLVTPSCCS